VDDLDKGELFEAFLPLAAKLAKRFAWSGYSLKELTSVAAVGLVDAIVNYDQTRFKNGLAAYAIPWINGAIKRFITQGRSVVIGERNERGKHMPRASHIAYFGNVMRRRHASVRRVDGCGRGR
jgi:DNA-directed RNA polymerase specialized sigma subunit